MPWTKTGTESIIGGATILYASKSFRAGVAAWTQKRHAAEAAVTKVISLAEWKLTKHIPNRYPYSGNDQKGSFADFYVYEKVQSRPSDILRYPPRISFSEFYCDIMSHRVYPSISRKYISHVWVLFLLPRI